MDPTGIYSSNRVKGTREEEERLEFRSLVNALDDLAKGHKEVLHVINILGLKIELGYFLYP